MHPCYTIHDLSELTGFSVRVIRKYIGQSLVPRPVADGYPTVAIRYGSDHLAVLKQIRDIQEQNMTLSDIYDRLHPYSGEDDDVE